MSWPTGPSRRSTPRCGRARPRRSSTATTSGNGPPEIGAQVARRAGIVASEVRGTYEGLWLLERADQHAREADDPDLETARTASIRAEMHLDARPGTAGAGRLRGRHRRAPGLRRGRDLAEDRIALLAEVELCHIRPSAQPAPDDDSFPWAVRLSVMIAQARSLLDSRDLARAAGRAADAVVLADRARLGRDGPTRSPRA